MTQEEKEDLEDAEAVCRAFVGWNLDAEATGVKVRLAQVLGRSGE